jgi:hypothetical protein
MFCLFEEVNRIFDVSDTIYPKHCPLADISTGIALFAGVRMQPQRSMQVCFGIMF